MFKKLLLLLFIVLACHGISTAQTSYAIDTKEEYSIKNITSIPFQPFSDEINKGLQNGLYWIKIENTLLSGEEYIIQIPNYHITDVNAFQGDKKLHQQKNERFVTYLLKDTATVFLKVNVEKEAYIPVEINSADDYQYKEKKSLLFIGFYYGFALMIFIINLFYYLTIKDTTFIYYCFFILFVSLGLFISDGIFGYYDVFRKLMHIFQAIDHSLVALFGAYFAMSYLQTNQYYPSLKNRIGSALVILGIVCIAYVFTTNFSFYVATEILVFSILGALWVASVTLFNKNIFSKIFVIAYVFILLLGIDYYVLKLFGLKVLGITSNYVKFGGFIEMLFLSYAVVYRVRILKEENDVMHHSLQEYLSQIESLSLELQKNEQGEENLFSKYQLTPRENEILTLISKGKTYKEIAKELFLSVNTIKYHVKNLYIKLGISSRKEAVIKFNTL